MKFDALDRMFGILGLALVVYVVAAVDGQAREQARREVDGMDLPRVLAAAAIAAIPLMIVTHNGEG
jgi:hypothetical protein